jgi:cellulose synthase/poly-beta-1,6-N-acetylglucosamine synthase-like glycosyltransferase
MNFAVLITTSGKEDIEKATRSFLAYDVPVYIVTPNSGLKFKDRKINIIQDKGEGKPQALNLALSIIKEEIILLTDGDVYTSKNALKEIMWLFDSKAGFDKTGLVTGKVVSLNNKNTMLGFWSHFLVFAANSMRKEKNKKGEYFEGTGYLMAVKKSLIGKIPKDIFSEDGYISYMVYTKGYKIRYTDKAKVYVKYPTTISDWLKQKRRSAGGYTQKYIVVKTRSFKKEAIGGIKLFFKYPKNLKEYYYLICLFLMRIYLWVIITIDLRIRKLKFKDIWVRVESTK